MQFLQKLFIPFCAVILALVSSMLVTADKQIVIYSTNISHISISLVIVHFLFGFLDRLYGRKVFLMATKNILICLLINISLLYVLLHTATPDNNNAMFYLQSYLAVYNPRWFFVVMLVTFLPIILLNNNFTVFKYLSWVSIGQLILGGYYYINNNLFVLTDFLFGYLLLILLCFLILMCMDYILINHYGYNYRQQPDSAYMKPADTNQLGFNQINRNSLGYNNLYFLLSLICVVLLINSHSICYKLVSLPGLGYLLGAGFEVVSASGIMFPFTFIIADIVAEHYGYAASRVLIWSTLIGQFVFVITVYFIYFLPGSISWANSVYFNNLFSNLIPRQLIAASLCVFFSFFIFSFMITILKTNLQNKKFWKRTLFANVVAKAVLCFVSYMVLYGGKYSYIFILSIIFNTWVLKMLIATLGTFLITIPMIYYLKLNDRRAYNYKNNYSPFSLKLDN